MKTKGLTIQEAIQSGLPFKRPHSEFFDEMPDDGHLRTKLFSRHDLLATDWQIKVPEVTITREKLAEAFDRVAKTFPYLVAASSGSSTFEKLAKELGL